MTERFTLLEKIGRGDMGVVWRARDEETWQIVALKLPKSAYAEDPDYVARFELLDGTTVTAASTPWVIFSVPG